MDRPRITYVTSVDEIDKPQLIMICEASGTIYHSTRTY